MFHAERQNSAYMTLQAIAMQALFYTMLCSKRIRCATYLHMSRTAARFL